VQVLVNDLPEAPYCDKLRSAVFASETYLVVFAGLFCRYWLRHGRVCLCYTLHKIMSCRSFFETAIRQAHVWLLVVSGANAEGASLLWAKTNTGDLSQNLTDE
jgi:hypothetical protein